MMSNKEFCKKCGAVAVWLYMPGTSTYCDDCVPRGCSCNLRPKDNLTEEELDNPNNWYELRDEQGKLLPCCEFEEIDS